MAATAPGVLPAGGDSGAAPMAPLGIVLSALIPVAMHAHYLGVARMPIALVPLVAVATLGASIWLRGVEGSHWHRHQHDLRASIPAAR